MATRLFSSAGDEIRFSPGGASALPNGSFSIFVIWRKPIATLSAGEALVAFQPDATSNKLFFGLNGSPPLLSQDFGGAVHNVQHDNLGIPIQAAAAGTWMLLGVTWNGTTGAAGSVFYGYTANSDGTWSAMSNNATAGTDLTAGWTTQGTLSGGAYIAVGQVEDVNDLSGNLAVMGGWSGVISGTPLSNVVASTRKTSNWWSADTANRPKFLWEFNGTVAAGVSDVTGGGATQSAITGTTQDTTNDVLGGWTYDAQGGQTAIVDAVLDAQWTDVGTTFQATAI